MPDKTHDPGKKTVYLILAGLLFAAMFMLSFAGRDDQEATALEKRLGAILGCVDGAGEVRVLIHGEGVESAQAWSAGLLQQESEREIVGVLIVAEGASDAAVAAKLAQAAGSVLGVDQSRIEVFAMKDR